MSLCCLHVHTWPLLVTTTTVPAWLSSLAIVSAAARGTTTLVGALFHCMPHGEGFWGRFDALVQVKTILELLATSAPVASSQHTAVMH